MTRFLERDEFVARRKLPLGDVTLLGRVEHDSPDVPDLGLDRGSHCVFLATDDDTIHGLDGEDSGQVEISLVGGEHFVTDRNPGSFSARLNRDEFTRRKLIINDRIDVGESFSFVFDGRSLERVQSDQSGQVKGNHLSKTYRVRKLAGVKTVKAVEDANVLIEPGDFVGVLGPSGCGKSTLMNMLCGNLDPSAGSVEIDGIDIHNTKGATKSLVGIVPQDDIVHPELTVWDAVRMSADLRLGMAISKLAKDNLSERVIVDLGLWPRRHNRVSELSGGQRKRVSVAVELLNDASVMFLDEPTSGLDPATERELMEQLHKLSCQGRTVICTTHVLQRAYLFTKLCVMAKGVVVSMGRLEEVMADFGIKERDHLVEIYHELEDPNRPAIPYDSASDGRRASREQVQALLNPEEISRDGDPITYFVGGSVARIAPDTFEKVAGIIAEDGGKLWGDVVVLFDYVPDNADDFYDTLINLRRILETNGGTLRIVSTPPALQQIIGMHRLNGIIRTYDKIDGALLESELGAPLDDPKLLLGLSLPMWGLLMMAMVGAGAGAFILYVIFSQR